MALRIEGYVLNSLDVVRCRMGFRGVAHAVDHQIGQVGSCLLSLTVVVEEIGWLGFQTVAFALDLRGLRKRKQCSALEP